IAAGALAAFETSNAGRILPGVHVGRVDLSGLTRFEAISRLEVAYAALADGELLLEADGTVRRVTFDSLGRRLDADRVVDRAMALGRDGETIERIASNVRNVVRGVRVEPVVTFEPAALAAAIGALAAEMAIAPADASVGLAGEDFALTQGRDGRVANPDPALRAATDLLVDIDAPSSIRVTLPLEVLEPSVTTDEAAAARAAALRIAVDIELVDRPETWTITGAALRGWISFAAMPDGGYGPVVARAGLEAGLAEVAAAVAREAVDASFLVGDGEAVVGVTDAIEGRALDVPGTVATLTELIEQRAHGLTVRHAPISITVLEPEFTTAEATQAAPLMEPISAWRTYFPIGIKNGGGANIWIPARDIDGYVVKPGAWFDFWEAIGPVTRERGYKDGGAIINGKTEPQGALAGGICSTSTTLFNAALRAGLEMGARRNHYYYIDRYPLGLDATVFQSSSGSVQTMSFRNDTEHPILIQGTGWKVGTKGYVKFVLWSVPTERDVDFTPAIVKNVKPASDSTVYTTRLAPGVKERIEFPVDGKDVWVTRIVRDAAGVVLHEEEYYSHYARITGILEIGIAPDVSPPPASPPPSPTP
ncbi:MAG TPA: VanW family protein, partial [Candidatus Sulfomarinibacteraceae bacterium]|nr:VanW family protein [Candidatus Sulfomarinibacteraceae bacterium]